MRATKNSKLRRLAAGTAIASMSVLGLAGMASADEPTPGLPTPPGGIPAPGAGGLPAAPPVPGGGG